MEKPQCHAAFAVGTAYCVVPPVVPPPLPVPGVVVAPPPPAAGGVADGAVAGGADEAPDELEGGVLDEPDGVALSFLLQAVSDTARTLAKIRVFVIIRISPL
ncbi:hypothetical protein BAU06_06995 [Bordetella bronchialis]|uniref:Secreted protein n=1 Tax=Bordetella bronchialis TaxID=463025 RepID=A0ABN4QYI0_9BORD|nr:hypothetical protein BAU06_06995 [Bordetella bronchialis]